jgi:hypothetical protein
MTTAAPSTLELQQELQRFATRFLDRISQAVDVLEASPEARVRDEGLRKSLLYVSSAMEIATGVSAEINLLDMFVFVRLSRAVLERHWIPALYRGTGGDLSEVFARTDDEITDIANRTLDPARRAQLDHIVASWLEDNPRQTRVEGLRLADFSAAAGTAAAARVIEAKGLLSSVRVASDAANQAMVLAERILFMVHRMPFLWRLQVRVGVREVTNDAITRASTDVPWTRIAQVARRGIAFTGVLALLGVVSMLRRRRRTIA